MNKFFILIHLLCSSTCFDTIMLIFRRTIVLVQHLVSSLSLGDCSVHSPLITCVLNSPPKRVTIPDSVFIQLSSWRWAQLCSKHVEECNNRIKIKNLFIKLVKKLGRIIFFLYFIIIISSASNPFKRSFSSQIFRSESVSIFLLSHAYRMLRLSHSP